MIRIWHYTTTTNRYSKHIPYGFSSFLLNSYIKKQLHILKFWMVVNFNSWMCNCFWVKNHDTVAGGSVRIKHKDNLISRFHTYLINCQAQLNLHPSWSWALALFFLSNRNPPSAIWKSIIFNLILATTPKLQPLPSNLRPQLKLILPSSAKPPLQLCWMAELALVSVHPAPPLHPGKFIW